MIRHIHTYVCFTLDLLSLNGIAWENLQFGVDEKKFELLTVFEPLYGGY